MCHAGIEGSQFVHSVIEGDQVRRPFGREDGGIVNFHGKGTGTALAGAFAVGMLYQYLAQVLGGDGDEVGPALIFGPALLRDSHPGFIDQEQLNRTLLKLDRLGVGEARPDAADLMRKLAAALSQRDTPAYPDRIATARIGEKVQYVELARVTHFFAEDKLTYAATKTKNHMVDHTIAELEAHLDPKRFYRVHRATIVNLAWIQETDSWFSGGSLVRLKDDKGTEVAVARDRVRGLKATLGF